MSLLLRFRSQILTQAVRSQLRLSSTKAEVENKEKTELDLRTFSLTPRAVAKSPALPPCAKEFFVGEIDQNFFPYLEVVEKEHLDKFFKERQTNTRYFLDQTKDEAGWIANLKQLGLFGLDGPQEMRGRGFSATETALNSEIEAENLGVTSILNPHRQVIQMISEFGSDQLKAKYLRRLVDGELIGTVAIFENEVSESKPFCTEASFSHDGYFLSGQKDFVINAHGANLFLVVSTFVRSIHSHKSLTEVGLFIVDGNEPGIVKGELLKPIGVSPVGQASVTFTNTPIKEENILGKQEDLRAMVMHLQKLNRLQNAIAANQLNKTILNSLVKHCIETKVVGGFLKDFELLQVQLGQTVSEIYAAESMIYFTTSLMDAYEKQDVELEAAMTKLYTFQTLMNNAILPFRIIGPKSTLDENSTYFRDAVQLASQGETLETVKLFIGLGGLEYAGNFEELAEKVNRARNPTQNPQSFLSILLHHNNFSKIKLTKEFIRYLHPSLKPSADSLEICLKRFEMCVGIVFERHGRKIVEAQMEVARLAQCATLLYAMLATVSRASRSYCIGLRFADVEILLANSFVHETRREIERLTTDIQEGYVNSNDMSHKTLASQLFDTKRYFPEHPLVRAF